MHNLAKSLTQVLHLKRKHESRNVLCNGKPFKLSADVNLLYFLVVVLSSLGRALSWIVPQTKKYCCVGSVHFRKIDGNWKWIFAISYRAMKFFASIELKKSSKLLFLFCYTERRFNWMLSWSFAYFYLQRSFLMKLTIIHFIS